MEILQNTNGNNGLKLLSNFSTFNVEEFMKGKTFELLTITKTGAKIRLLAEIIVDDSNYGMRRLAHANVGKVVTIEMINLKFGDLPVQLFKEKFVFNYHDLLSPHAEMTRGTLLIKTNEINMRTNKGIIISLPKILTEEN